MHSLVWVPGSFLFSLDLFVSGLLCGDVSGLIKNVSFILLTLMSLDDWNFSVRGCTSEFC